MADDGWRLGHRPGLDGLRGIAVLLVVVGHGLSDTMWTTAGVVGVTLFFVLSGFLITRLLLEELWRRGRVDLRAFYVRRARRLLPAIPFALALAAVANSMQATPAPVAEPVGHALTYTINFATDGESYAAFRHLWSLAVEEHFYVVWPILFAVVPLRLLPALAVSGAAASTLARIAESDPVAAYQWTPYRVDAILIGAVLAFCVSRLRRPTWPTVAIATAVLAAFVPTQSKTVFLGWGCTAVALASAVVILAAVHSPARSRPLERMGVISYGVYLYHFPLVYLVSALGIGDGGAPRMLLILAASVLLAELSWRLVELPMKAPAAVMQHSDSQVAKSVMPPSVVGPPPTGPSDQRGSGP